MIPFFHHPLFHLRAAKREFRVVKSEIVEIAILHVTAENRLESGKLVIQFFGIEFGGVVEMGVMTERGHCLWLEIDPDGETEKRGDCTDRGNVFSLGKGFEREIPLHSPFANFPESLERMDNSGPNSARTDTENDWGGGHPKDK